MANEYTILQSDGVTSFTVYPLESNGPGNSTLRQLKATDISGGAGTNFFKLHGDVTYRFIGAFTFDVVGSNGDDGPYTVVSSSHDVPSNITTIIVVEAIPSGLAPIGNIQYVNPDDNTSLRIPGRGVQSYGEQLAINSVRMLENFAHTVAPVNPLLGQLWYDTSSSELKIFGGATFDSAGGGDPAYTSDAVPTILPIATGVDSLAAGDGASTALTGSIAFGATATAIGANTVAIGTASITNEGNTVAIGNGSIAGKPAGAGSGGVAVGYLAKANMDGTVALGTQSTSGDIADSNAVYGIAIGQGSEAKKRMSIAIGHIATANANQAIAIGENSDASVTGSLAIGYNPIASGQNSIAIGFIANATATGAVAIGNATNANGDNSVAIKGVALEVYNTAVGYSSTAGQTSGGVAEIGATALGYAAKAYEDGTVAIGYGAWAGVNASSLNPDAIAIGRSSRSLRDSSIAIGNGAQSNYPNTIAVGTGALVQNFGEIVHSVGAGIDDRTIVIKETFTGIAGGTYTPMSAFIAIKTNKAWKFTINVIARQDVIGVVAAYKFDGIIKRIGATTSIVGTTTKQVEEDLGAVSWDCDVIANNTLNTLEIQFDADTTTNQVYVLANIHIVEV